MNEHNGNSATIRSRTKASRTKNREDFSVRWKRFVIRAEDVLEVNHIVLLWIIAGISFDDFSAVYRVYVISGIRPTARKSSYHSWLSFEWNQKFWPPHSGDILSYLLFTSFSYRPHWLPVPVRAICSFATTVSKPTICVWRKITQSVQRW